MASSSVIDTLAGIVAGKRAAHPIRVGVDGRSAAGKTTLADAGHGFDWRASLASGAAGSLGL
jgi:hypothetical protein